MIGLHLSLHHNAFAFFQVGGLAVVENHFGAAAQAVNGIKRKVVGVFDGVVFNGLALVYFGNEMNIFSLLFFGRVNGIVGGEIAGGKNDQGNDQGSNGYQDDDVRLFHSKKFVAKLTQLNLSGGILYNIVAEPAQDRFQGCILRPGSIKTGSYNQFMPQQNKSGWYSRELAARLVFGWLFVVLLYFFFTQGLATRLQQAGLVSERMGLLQHYPAALGFDILLTCSCIICFIIPQQRFFTWLTLAGMIILHILYAAALQRNPAQAAYLITLLPFLALTDENFTRLWSLFRYLVCLLYAAAGTWLIIYILMPNNGADAAGWFVFNRFPLPVGGDTGMLVYRAGIFISLLMVTGVFSKRFDLWLLAAGLVFYLVNLLLLHIPFVEQTLIFAAFLPWRAWTERLQIPTSDD